jgi:hypothetical protein
MEYLESKTYAHVFLKDEMKEIDVYTDNPRFEAALLTAFSSDPNEKRYIEVQYEVVDKTNKVVRVILDREFTAT